MRAAAPAPAVTPFFVQPSQGGEIASAETPVVGCVKELIVDLVLIGYMRPPSPLVIIMQIFPTEPINRLHLIPESRSGGRELLTGRFRLEKLKIVIFPTIAINALKHNLIPFQRTYDVVTYRFKRDVYQLICGKYLSGMFTYILMPIPFGQQLECGRGISTRFNYWATSDSNLLFQTNERIGDLSVTL